MVKRCFEIGAVLSTGLKKTTNQDRILALVGEINNEEFGIFVVADGVGGMDFGGVASEYVISSIKKWWELRIKEIISQSVKNVFEQLDTELDDLLQKLNSDIFEYGIKHRQKGGTTLSLIFIYCGSYILKHTGDSRIYVLDSEIIQLTKDQTLVKSEEDYEIKLIEQSNTNPMKNILTMCLGVFKNLELQTLSGKLRENAVIIVCSDGFHRYYNSQKLCQEISVLRKNKGLKPQEMADVLLNKVLSMGACDNVSLIIVRAREESYIKLF